MSRTTVTEAADLTSDEINTAWAKGRAKRDKGLHGVHNEIVRAFNAQKRKRVADAAGTKTINPPANPAKVKQPAPGKPGTIWPPAGHGSKAGTVD